MSQTQPRWYFLWYFLSYLIFSVLAFAGFWGHKAFAEIGLCLMGVLLAVIIIRGILLAGPPRAFAVGFLIPCVLYLAPTFFVSSFEYTASHGRLLTTRLMQEVIPPRNPNSGRAEEWIRQQLIQQREENAFALMSYSHFLMAFCLGSFGGRYGASLVARSADPARPQ